MKETPEIKDLCKKIEKNIFQNLQFFNENILEKMHILNINLTDINKYFYEISIALVKLNDIEEIDFEVIKYLIKLIETIKYDENEDFVIDLKINLMEFILNPNIFKKDEVNIEILYPALQGLLKIFKENIVNENFQKKILREEYFNQLFLFLWIFDDINNIKENKNIQKEDLIKSTKNVYLDLLVESLKAIVIKNENEGFQLIEISDIKKNMITKEKTKEETREESDIIKSKQNKIIELVFEKLYEYKDNINIFCIILNLIKDLNLIQNADLEKIIKTLKLIIQEKNIEEKNTKNKILNLCIIYLVQIYLIDEDIKNIKEKNFHSFIRKLGMNLDVIYSLISSINLLKIEKKEKENEINIKTDTYDETLININLEAITEKNINVVNIIKSILEDITFILNSGLDKNDPNSLKDILDVLEKNINYIFESVKKSQNIYLKDIFSSDAKICAEFFYFKWKTVNEKKNFLENLLKNYNILIKIFPNPFFFKFYDFLLKEVPEGSNDEEFDKIKIYFLSEIINYFEYFLKDSEQKENNISLINNLFNFAIILDLEYEKKISALFEMKEFKKIFFKYINILDKTGVLYSNYYMELNGNKGKIISEIIFDIYFSISSVSFDHNRFINIFIKSSNKSKENFTIFYFIDICKEKFLERDKTTMESLKGFIPHYENIIFLRNYLKKNKMGLFLKKNLFKIEHVNLSIYFLAKSFIYYKKGNLNPDLKKFLNDSFFSCLSQDIYHLYTKNSRFYGNELCKTFPLYFNVKTFIETNIIPDKNFTKYLDYINNEMPMELKDEFNLESSFSSRLAKNKKNTKKKISLDEIDLEEKNPNMQNDIMKENKKLNFINNKYNFLSSKTMHFSNLTDLETSLNKSNNESSKLSSEKDDDSSINIILNSEKLNLNTFADIKKETKIINNGKKYFLQIIFSEIYKNLLFYDKTFMKIKSTFLSKYRKYQNVEKETKQLNYPSIQKNFSNSFEPKLFFKKDSNFYDKFYLEKSHKYLNINKVFENLQNIEFYPHLFKFDEKIEKNKFLFCELVNTRYISFGKIFFFDDYLIFKTEKEDPRDTSKDLDIFIKYGISIKNKDYPSKKKMIIIYSKDINEIIQRRTLLVNNSIEIFMKSGKSYFFNFFRSNNAKQAYNYLNELNKNLIKKNYEKFYFVINSNEEDIKILINSFKKGKITNYEYILKLNKYSTRTYNDTSQYPVFPWLINKYDDIKMVLSKLFSKENLNVNEFLPLFRDMNYSHTLQNEEKRKIAYNNFDTEKKQEERSLENFEDNEINEIFPSHLNNHYSTPAYIFYYLMRLNPYLQNIIKLQGEELEDTSRTFNNFKDTEESIEYQNDNREIIPDFFCYFDFLINSNCTFFGEYDQNLLIDDFIYIARTARSKYINKISSFAISLIDNYRLLNNYFVSRIINNWVDIIFGTRQLPSNFKDLYKCCNIYKKYSYEQKTNLEEELKPFEEKISLNQKNEEEEKKLMDKIEPMIVGMTEFGVCPKKILDENVVYDGKAKTYDSLFKSYKFLDDKLIYFNYIDDEKYILIKDVKKNKTKKRIAMISENKNLKDKENATYNLKSMNLMKEKNGIKNIQLYQYKYSFSYLNIQFNKTKIFIVLSCRYFENYFRVQHQEKIINIFYDDFITCIKGRNINEYDNIFYTGLINGKLTEWEIIPFLDINIKNKKKSIKSIYNFEIKEKKHVYAHKSSISAIEIYSKQKIIITAGEDKFIYIRKIFDFELMTAIDLTYSFGNPIVSQYLNIFPSMVKISDLNLLFVMIYDYHSKNFFIRGYNLNGIFFAQTEDMLFEDNLQINNFSFTKYSNLIVGFNNSDKFFVLNAGVLTPIWITELEKKDEEKKEKKSKKEKLKEKIDEEIENKIVEFNCNNGEFYVLKEQEVIFTSINDKLKLKEFDSF